jgi:hypothetical protein
MLRAFCDDLAIKPYHDGRHIVHHAGLTGGYVVTRDRSERMLEFASIQIKERAKEQ